MPLGTMPERDGSDERQIRHNYDRHKNLGCWFNEPTFLNWNFEAKKKYIEEFDAALPILLGKKPDVLAITGDHSTPCAMKGHSWHPQPVLLHSKISGSDKLERFTETGANLGSLGVFEAKFLIRLMQANARMFDKFGA